eukprot:Gb_15060 [translate_table: standard]
MLFMRLGQVCGSYCLENELLAGNFEFILDLKIMFCDKICQVFIVSSVLVQGHSGTYGHVGYVQFIECSAEIFMSTYDHGCRCVFISRSPMEADMLRKSA